jgi:hypothetical protein
MERFRSEDKDPSLTRRYAQLGILMGNSLTGPAFQKSCEHGARTRSSDVIFASFGIAIGTE